MGPSIARSDTRPNIEGRATAEVLGPDVGKRIRAARQSRGMSLAQVGRDDLSRSFLSLVELGRSRISIKALAIVADRLDLPMSYFLEGDVAPRGAAAELLLDEAQAHVEQHDGEAALRTLDGIEVPDSLRARASLIRAGALLAAERLRDAITEAEAGLLQAQRVDDTHREAQLRCVIGIALYRMGALDEAHVQLRQVLGMVNDTHHDPALQARVAVSLGHILHSQGDPAAALEYFEGARQQFDLMNNLNEIAAAYSRLSVAYEGTNDYASALHYSKLSLALYERRQNLLDAATELNDMALRYWDLGDLDRAEATAQNAMERAREAGSAETEARAHGTLAQLSLERGRSDDARREADIAARMAASDTSPARVDAWRVLAKLAEDNGEHERADELYGKTLDILQTSDQRSRYADVAVAYSKILRERGDTDRAFDLALKAAQMKSVRSS